MEFADFVIPTLKSLASPKFDFVKFHKESSFFLSEAFDRLGLPLSEVNDYKGVGPNCPKVGKLPSNLETFVNDPKSKGTIFVAFGSHAKWDIAPKYITNAFFEAFSYLTDYRFIFSFNGKIKSSVPKHILILEWSPQKEILNHPKTKIFISHSGLKSTTEAICAAIPIIFMPLYAEQKANSQFLTYFGHAETLDKFSVSAKDVIEAIERIEINFPKRKQKMEKLKRLYLDRIINPMDEASFYVTKVIKANKGNGRLPFKRVSTEQSWFIFLSFDLFALLFAFVFIVSK
uniref:glucuronosyltransferase n=1 Tax=Panagrolaimus davidi TaxID=227884 RepID=A0A914PCU4_9BILA